MGKTDDHKHDFLSILHCKKCGEQFHINWPDAAKQAKLDAVEEVLYRLKLATIDNSPTNKDREKANAIVLKSIKKVRKDYKKSTGKDRKEATEIVLRAIENSDGDYKGTISES